MNITIESVSSEYDFLKCLPLIQKLLTEEENTIETALPDHICLQSWKNAQLHGYTVYSIKDGSGIIIGTFGLTKIYDPISEVPSFRLNNFIIREDHRNKTIGSQTMDWIEHFVASEGGKYIFFEVMENNENAIRFYNRRKFSKLCIRMIKDVSKKSA